MLDFAAGGFGIEAVDVALFADFIAGLDIHLKQVVAEQPTGEVTEFAARRDGGNQGDDALGNEDFGDLGDAADVFQTVLVGEPQVGIEPAAQVVAIEDGGEAPLLVQDPFGGVGDGGLAGARKSVEPDDEAALAEKIFLLPAR